MIPHSAPTAMVLVAGDDVYEDMFGASSELSTIASEAGFATTRRMGLGSVAWMVERGGLPDVLVLYTAMGECTERQQQALAKAVHEGMGLVAVHCANVFPYTPTSIVPGYETIFNLIGSRFAAHGPHPHDSRFTCNIDPTHPLTEGIEPFAYMHEHYMLEMAKTDDRVLAWRDASDGSRQAVLTAGQRGAGRVVYLQYGHDSKSWREPSVRLLVSRAVTWAQRGAAEDSERAAS